VNGVSSLAAGIRATQQWEGGSMDVEAFARLDLSDFAFVELTADRDKFEGYAGLMLRF
jgi:hypothetical protein